MPFGCCRVLRQSGQGASEKTEVGQGRESGTDVSREGGSMASAPCFSNLGPVSEFVFTVGTDTGMLRVVGSEHANAGFGDERATVLTFRHTENLARILG